MSGAETPLDRAMRAAGGDATDGRAVDALLNAELLLWLEAPAEGGRLRPRVLPLEAGPTALAFDTEDRLAAFAGEADYAALPGRALATLLAGEGLHLAVNPGVEASELFHDRAALAWMAQASSLRAEGLAARIETVGPPAEATESLIAALDAKLAALAPALSEAWLAGARHEGGERRLLLALAERGAWGPGEAGETHRAALVRAVSETARLAAPDAPLDVAFPSPDSALMTAARRVGLGFELPAPDPAPARAAREAPGANPAKPPRLR